MDRKKMLLVFTITVLTTVILLTIFLNYLEKL